MLGYYKLPAGFNSLITAELEQGEKILWQDQPQPYYFSSRSVSNLVGGMIAFCIISTVFFNIFRYTPELTGITEIVVILFMVIFLVGVVAAISSPLMQYRRLKKTVYLLTNRRVTEIVVRRKPRIHSWPIDSITQIRLEEQTSSLGNVEIVQGVRIIGDDPGEQKGFFSIKRAGEVARQLNRLTGDGVKIIVQEGEKPVASTARSSQRLLEEGPSSEKKSFFLQLLSNDLFRLVMFFLLAGIFFGTPAAMAWGTNTGRAGFCFFLLLFVIWSLINPMRWQAKSGHWPATEGVIEESWIARIPTEDTPSYRPHILYRYRVGDKVYRNTCIDDPCVSEESMNMSKKVAERKATLYPEGIPVTVYHDPKHPSFSVLEVGKVNHWKWLFAIILLPLLVWSGYYIYTTWSGFEPDRFRILWEQVKEGKEHGSSFFTKSDRSKYVYAAKYVGEWKHGRKHGKGTYTGYDGSKYVGEYKDDKKHGHGTKMYVSGAKYVGEWKDGKKHGKGAYTWSDGSKYVGGYKDGKSHGHGTKIHVTGAEYVGEWKDGRKHGKGTYTRSNGSKYVGEYKDSEKHGYGTKIYVSGAEYAGEWVNSKRNGYGTYTWSNGNIYEGQWQDGSLHGHGTKIYVSGAKYVGEWKDWKKHGKGTFTKPNGNKYIGIWNNGELQEKL